MTPAPENPPAFPLAYLDKTTAGVVNTVVTDGMSLRDWYAGQIACGDAQGGNNDSWSPTATDEMIMKRTALYFRIADAMLSARTQPKPTP